MPFAVHLGLRMDEARPGVARMSCALQPHMTNSMGAAHGGVLMTLLDVTLCMAARTLHPNSAGVITIDMNTAFIGTGRGRLLAEGRVLRNGRSIIFVEGEITNEDGSLVAKGSATVRAQKAPGGD